MRRCDWGTLTKKQVAVLRELVERFAIICADSDNKIDPADRKRFTAARRILGVSND